MDRSAGSTPPSAHRATAFAAVRQLGARRGLELVPPRRVTDLTPREVRELQDTLRTHTVIGLRGQHLDPAEHRHFLTRLGTVRDGGASAPAPARTDGPGCTAAVNRWVSERSHLVAPPEILSLRTTSPDVAGECTLFADAVGAYRDLPRPLRALADRSWALHGEGLDGGTRPDPVATRPLVAHPVTRIHPESGDRALLLGGHARGVLGLADGESRTVVHLLQSYLVQPHNVLRWDWEDGDLLLVDARAVQVQLRRAAGTEPPTTAALHLAGTPPLGVDGRHSRRFAAGSPTERRSA